MANSQATNTKELHSFLKLKEHEQFAIVQKSEGKPYDEIVALIRENFKLDYSVSTLNWWFMAGGRLEQAYLDYLEELGNEAIKEGKLLIRRGTRAAASTLISKLASKDEGIQIRAAIGLLNKYVPDKQILITEDGIGDDDLPEELSDAADEIVTGGKHGANQSGTAEPGGDNASEPADSNDGASDTGSESGAGETKPSDGSETSGSEPVDDTRQSQEAEESTGAGTGENVPEGVLQEREATDTSGDTPS